MSTTDDDRYNGLKHGTRHKLWDEGPPLEEATPSPSPDLDKLLSDMAKDADFVGHHEGFSVGFRRAIGARIRTAASELSRLRAECERLKGNG